jgi:hemerythrin superfamily protein
MDNTTPPTHPQTHSAKNELGPLLSSEHTRLEQLFEEVLSAFQADARIEARTLWSQFDAQLRAHMALEESRILPRLADVNAPEAAALRREHDILREKLLQLGIGVDLHFTRDTHVEDFLRVLRAHAKREDKLMYRFCAEH